MKNKNLKGLYAITSSNLKDEALLKKIRELLELGINIVQFRDKIHEFDKKLILAKKIKKICENFNSIFIVNDDPLLAKEAKADGVHIGQDDITYNEAREILGPNSIIGISCQNDLNLALNAESLGANYVSFGSVFNTTTKKNTVRCSISQLKSLASSINLPSVAIGGINKTNLQEVKSTVDMYAISSGLFEENSLEEIIELVKNLKN
tara:strand:- start:3598 stop:4218 length:621 start_codon:yes stop_codon:yes gene_type:complete